MAFQISGKIIGVASKKTAKGKPFKLVQIVSDGTGLAHLQTCSDYDDREWKIGTEGTWPVYIDAFMKKAGGAGYSVVLAR